MHHSTPVSSKVVIGLLLALPLMAEWQPLGPFGGAAAIVQADPFHPDTVVAAASNGLLFRSTDAGGSWQALPFPLALRGALRAFLIDPRQPDTYLAGFSGASPEASGLFRSLDAGSTWNAVSGLRGREVWSLAVWRRDPRVIAVGTASGVYLTRDAGETWRLVSDPANREMAIIVSLAFDPLDDSILFAGTPHLAWKTANGGSTWRPIYTGMHDDSDVFSISVDPVHPQRVFASACSGIYRSRNAGALWSKLPGAPGASYRTYFVAIDPREEDTVFAGTTHGLVRSTDGGATWRQLSTDSTRFVAFDPHRRGRIFVATDDNGIERSDDQGEHLRSVNQGFCNRELPATLAGADALYTHTVYERDNGGIFRLPADGERWERLALAPRLNGEELQVVVPDSAVPSRWYGAAYNSLMTSSDAGAHWTPARAFPKSRVRDLFCAPGGTYVLAATDSGLYRSADAGKTWKIVPITSASHLRAFFPLEKDRVAAVSSHGIFISGDGMLWQAAGPLPDNAEPLGVLESGSLFAATSSGLIYSQDNAQTWRPVRGGLPGSTVQAICKHPARPGVLVAAQFDGVYESRDNGKSWERISPIEPHLAIRQMRILPETANRLFVLTERQGIFALPLEAPASGASN